MTIHHPRTVAAAALAATSLLLAACSSSSPSHATPATQSHSSSSPAAAAGSSATPAASTSTAGSTSPAGPAGAAPAACTLITEQDAGTALGADPGPGKAISPGHCLYGADAASVNVLVQPLPGGSGGFQGLRAAMGARSVDVSGVGAAAFGVFTGSMGVVEFYQGQSLVSIALSVAGASGPLKDKTIALAKAAAGRL